MKITPITIMSSTAAVGEEVRGSIRAIACGSMPSSAAAKKMRGAVIIEPFSVPNVLTAITAEIPTHARGTYQQTGDVRRHELGVLIS